ncbi:MAG: DNA polymerase III subunit gamma/tau [Janthinobacterium lividum]
MAYQVLARKYRPQRFADVAGQDHVTRTLQNALEQNRIAHGYIFSGHRGIGKTTIARILASALNCRNTIGSAERPTPEPCGICDSCIEVRAGNAVDVIEIDAATNRGIDEIRELRDAARYRPARDRFKIYILDEAHQITDAAFNALLKTLEEPPDHIVFMMATTEPENIPQTIRSRCQHFSFHAVKLDDIMTEIRGIAAHEGVLADEAALALLAEAGDGSMRDALSIMDQAIASAPVVNGKAELSAGEIRELMGTVPNTVFEDMLESVARNDSAAIMGTAGRLLDAGNSSSQIARQFVRYLRNCIVAKITTLTEEQNTSELLQISPDERRRAVRSAMLFTEEELTRFLQVMLRTFDDLGFRQEQRLHLELGLIKLVHLQRLLPVEEFLSQLPRPAQGNTPRTIPAQRASTPAAPARSTTPAPSRFTQSQSQVQQQTAPESTTSLSNAGTGPASLRDAADAPEQVFAAPPGVTIAQETTSPRSQAEAVALPSHVSHLTVDHAIVEPDASTGLATHEPAHNVVLPEGLIPQTIFTPMPQPVESTLPAEVDATLPGDQERLTDTAQLQAAAVEALFETKKHNSAAEQLEESTWVLANGEVQVSTTLSKSLMGTIFRPDVEAIIKTALRTKGLPGVRLVFIPAALNDRPKAPKKPRTGSAQAKALEHPTVQAAQRLFNAEVTNVFDLRKD